MVIVVRRIDRVQIQPVSLAQKLSETLALKLAETLSQTLVDCAKVSRRGCLPPACGRERSGVEGRANRP